MERAKKSPEDAYGSIAIFLTGDIYDNPSVSQFELRREEYVKRITLRCKCGLADVFRADFAELVSSVLLGFERRSHSRHLPEFSATVGNVILRDLRITRVENHGGDPLTAVRLARHFGDLRDILSEEHLHGWRSYMPVDKLALEVLTDIALPLLNLAERGGTKAGPVNEDLNAEIARRLSALNRRRGEILMNLDLLKRFVRSAPSAKSPGARQAEYQPPRQAPRRRLDA